MTASTVIVVDMEQLSALDAGFLEAEDADPHISLAIGGIAILDGPVEPQNVLVASLTDRLAAIPRFTQVLRVHTLKYKAPQWETDPNFDILRHVRRVAVPAPGDDGALFDLAADIMAHRLDREHPLWECWIIEGLEHDRWAILMKLHHCIADGIAATNTLAALFDDGSAATFADQIHGAGPAHDTLQRNDKDPYSVRLLRSAWQTTTGLPRQLIRAGSGALWLTAEIVRPSKSSLTGPLGSLRRYRAVRVPLTDIEQVCAAFEVTVNDVALAAVTDGFRAVLLSRHESPGQAPIRSLVPVSTRRLDALGTIDNRVSAMLAHLPVDIDDPVLRLAEVHRRLSVGKHSGQPQATAMLMQVSRFVPFALSGWTVRLLTAMPQRGVVTLTTNVPGPRDRHTVNGHTVQHLLPMPPIGLGLRTGVAMLTYADELAFGVTADWDTSPDLDLFTTRLQRAVDHLVAASHIPTIPTDGTKRYVTDHRRRSTAHRRPSPPASSTGKGTRG